MWIRTVSGWRFFEVDFTAQGIPFVKAKEKKQTYIQKVN
jgi:hypothetical protein